MGKTRLGLVVAADAMGGIGYKNDIPWKLKGDLKNFRAITIGNVVIMGRKTYESLGKALEGRINIVVTSGTIPFRESEDVFLARSVEEAIEIGRRFGTDWIYFIGGAKIYETALPLVELAYVTLVHQTKPVDTRINNFDFPVDKWDLVNIVHGPLKIDRATGFGSITHSYLTFARKP